MMEVARTPLGPIAIEPKALARLVLDAVETVGGAKVLRPGTLQVSVGEEGAVSVAVTIAAPRRAVLPELGREVQRHVAEAVETALGTLPAAVDVTIERIEE